MADEKNQVPFRVRGNTDMKVFPVILWTLKETLTILSPVRI
jgi:hypothetical protein